MESCPLCSSLIIQRIFLWLSFFIISDISPEATLSNERNLFRDTTIFYAPCGHPRANSPVLVAVPAFLCRAHHAHAPHVSLSPPLSCASKGMQQSQAQPRRLQASRLPLMQMHLHSPAHSLAARAAAAQAAQGAFALLAALLAARFQQPPAPPDT